MNHNNKETRPPAIDAVLDEGEKRASCGELIQVLEHLEAALIHAITADVDVIAIESRTSLLSLAHSLTCQAIDKAHASRTI